MSRTVCVLVVMLNGLKSFALGYGTPPKASTQGATAESRQNAPVEHFERVSEQLCCEGMRSMGGWSESGIAESPTALAGASVLLEFAAAQVEDKFYGSDYVVFCECEVWTGGN